MVQRAWRSRGKDNVMLLENPGQLNQLVKCSDDSEDVPAAPAAGAAEDHHGEEVIRIISARRAEKHEIRRYQEQAMD